MVVIEIEFLKVRERAEGVGYLPGEGVSRESEAAETSEVGEGVGYGAGEGVIREVEKLQKREVPGGGRECAGVTSLVEGDLGNPAGAGDEAVAPEATSEAVAE